MPITLSSRAKVNIGLKITDRRDDGYHTIVTIFQEISLADEIILDEASEGCTLTCSGLALPTNHTNLCVKAYNSLKKAVPRLDGVSIHLEKRIPVSGGLGGGSSNAATVLTGVNDLFGLELSDGLIKEMAVTLGADVPFFLKRGTQLAEGIGDRLTPVSLPTMESILLVCPSVEISTAWAYGKVKNSLSGRFEAGNFAALIEEHSSWESLGKFFENDFESLVFRTYPEIGDLKKRLLDAGAGFASLSGSGSTVFGIFEDNDVAEKALKQFSSFQTFITHPVTR
ncbi:MAG TPA: 4-(cytidine 5'-diphospho)-2-C-methyl-D-erythritol kinase [Candidatus Marinimicrobia bacterium]|nr:4-(cytidine 5'-diphospho)-2-C-methyl-D-erythritol kinase [Candidatus Neomarinimicrobiota bacterium]